MIFVKYSKISLRLQYYVPNVKSEQLSEKDLGKYALVMFSNDNRTT